MTLANLKSPMNPEPLNVVTGMAALAPACLVAALEAALLGPASGEPPGRP
ncbi:hypothetical protein HPC49_15210 [Pyxidicoccus fallax]|uniref:Uncharacterized protein n=1 Tax=Pyxidicoccus fallax TaxID=394095 RepID=A0A848LIU7_9BACT|nr:hypothetical protein [Pyxidicoccus fallax]NMO17643.1 hypothetical protein [Pyxidicoccus fallax]NPC79567.1 hypothetical protein [Pyxidicoccus fallax]